MNDRLELPLLSESRTVALPGGRGGDVTVIEVSVFWLMVAAVPPNVIEVTRIRSRPVMVTLVPPVDGPLVA